MSNFLTPNILVSYWYIDSFSYTHTHTQIDSLLGLTALGSAAMLGEVVAVGVAALAGVNVAIFVHRFYMECTHKSCDIVLA